MTAPRTAAPRSEKGFVQPNSGWLNAWGVSVDTFEQTPDLRWPTSVWTYAKMAREDARVASVLRAIGLPIRRTAWRICPNGAREDVYRHVAADLGLPIEGESEDEPTPRSKGRFSWQRHLQQALTAQQYGHAVFELSARYDGAVAHLSNVAPRPQSTIAFWNVAPDGELISVQQWGPGTFATPGMLVMAPATMGDAIGADRLVVYTRDMEPGVWTGNSLLRPAFKHWLLKDELMRIEAAATRRHGIGVPWLKGNESDSQSEERMDELLSIASNYSGGESAGLALTDGEEAGIMSPSGTPMDPRRAIEYHDHAIATVALAHFLNLDGKGGSYALASVQADTFVQSVQTVAADIRDVAQSSIVEAIVDWNWGPDEPAPRLVFDEIGSRQDATAAALMQLVNAGLLTPDARLEAFLRSSTGLPAPDPETEREPADDTTNQQDAEPPTTDDGQDSSTTTAPQARKRPRGRSPKDRRKSPDGGMTLW